MTDDLLTPIQSILRAADDLLAETHGLLTVQQEKSMQTIRASAAELEQVLITLPDLVHDRSRKVMSYEARSHLASIIGYAEMLLEEIEGPLTAQQAEALGEIRSIGKQLTSRVIALLER